MAIVMHVVNSLILIYPILRYFNVKNVRIMHYVLDANMQENIYITESISCKDPFVGILIVEIMLTEYD